MKKPKMKKDNSVWVGTSRKEKVQIAQSLTDIRAKFKKWWLYIGACAISYVVLFIVSKLIVSWVKPHAKKYFVNDWTTLFIAVILGFCTIADSRASGYLKSSLQRLGFCIEKSLLTEKAKDQLLTETQDTNELFKTTFQRFGLTALPVLLVSIIDNGVAKVVNGENTVIGKVIPVAKKSENWIFYIYYVIPVLLVTWKIWQISKHLQLLETDFHSYDNRQYSTKV